MITSNIESIAGGLIFLLFIVLGVIFGVIKGERESNYSIFVLIDRVGTRASNREVVLLTDKDNNNFES